MRERGIAEWGQERKRSGGVRGHRENFGRWEVAKELDEEEHELTLHCKRIALAMCRGSRQETRKEVVAIIQASNKAAWDQGSCHEDGGEGGSDWFPDLF